MLAMGNSCIFQSQHTPLTLPKRPKIQISREGKMRLSVNGRRRRLVVKGCQEEVEKERQKRKSFLTMEEAGLVEMSGLSTHERFLCRLTISSLNLLKVVAEQEGLAVEELNAGSVCDWFVKDKLKREQNIDTAVLQWDDSDFQM